MGFFRANKPSLQVLAAPNTGFRPGQLGAVHSVLSHYSVYNEPATVCLPTGYGKTAVMMALPFFLDAKRVLIVEPSEALRRQTSGHFRVLSTLRKLRVLPDETPNPKVLEQKGRPISAEDWAAMRENDVVISTPQSTSPSLAPDPPADLFDVIIFDEAHHAPAETWAAYLDHYTTARFVFLTATPFRRDRKPIPGRLTYSYPVTKASQEKAFGRVTFRPAPVRNDHDEEEVDRSVAETAINQLRADREAGYDHRIFARAASIKSAKRLVDIYLAAGAKVAAINSHISRKVQDHVEQSLLSGDLDGVICVDMFGEGYDFPKLKVAALHAPHRSLVPTLQFIGRFARTNDVSTGDATLIAPISRLKEANFKLFQEGINIAELIDEAAQEHITDDQSDREILEILKLKRQTDSDYAAVTPLLLQLYAHARIFECNQQPDFSLVKQTVGRNLQLAKQWLSDDGLITLILTVDNSPPNWATADALANLRHDVFLLAYNQATKLCYIGSTRRTDRLYIDLMQTVCEDQHRPISFEMTRRAIAGLSDLRFYNVGLKNTAINTQAESYRVLTGPRAERAVTAGDARSFVQGHFFGSGNAGDERETIGASSSSRVWSNKRLTVSEYLNWISDINARLNGRDEVEASQLDIVQHAKVLRRLPDVIIAAGWHKTAYRYAPRIRYRNRDEAPWAYHQITDLDITNFIVGNEKRELEFSIGCHAFQAQFRFSIEGGALVTQAAEDYSMEVLSGVDDWMPIATWLSMHPPVFHAADKSSFQGVNLMRPPSTVITRLADGDAVSLDWNNCAIDVEFGAIAGGTLTVHQYLEQHLLDLPGLEFLVYDHRSGEAADFIAVINEEDADIRVCLYHCKGAGGQPSGGRVNDVYEVAGQLLKSIAYCDPLMLSNHVEHRVNADRHVNPSRFMVGNIDRFQRVLKETPANRLYFEIYGVQPGIAKARIDEHLADLMAFGLEYVQRGGAAKAAWIISP